MNDSLSIIVPVRNAEASLAGQVARLLEILPDLTGQFEIVVVDDASTDHTVELVRDLAAQFPQLKLFRHRDVRGIEAAIRTGLQWATGRTVFVQDDPASLSTSDLRRLWALRHEEDLVVARSDARPRVFDEQLLQRLAAWGRKVKSLADTPGGAGGTHMIRRDAALLLLAVEPGDETATEPVSAATGKRTDTSHAAALPRRARTFLRHLSNLALGE